MATYRCLLLVALFAAMGCVGAVAVGGGLNGGVVHNMEPTTDMEPTTGEQGHEVAGHGDTVLYAAPHEKLSVEQEADVLAEIASLERVSNSGAETRAQHHTRRARRGFSIALPKLYADHYSGVFRKSATDTKFVAGMSYTNFISYWKAQALAGMRLTDIEVRAFGNAFEYSGVFSKGTGGYALWVGANWRSFVAKWKELSANNLRLIDIETYMSIDGRTRLYTGVFRSGSNGYALYHSKWSSFNAKRKELAASRVFLTDLEVYYSGGATKYLGVFQAGARRAPLLRFTRSWTKFVADWKAMNEKGKQLIDFEFYKKGTKTRFAGMYGKSSASYFLWHNVDYESFKGAERYGASLGLRLFDLELAPGTCSAKCSNNVIADSAYNYKVSGDTTTYRWPVDTDGGQRYVRHTALHFSSHPKFTLPFTDAAVKLTGGWRYGNLGYHHALDFSMGTPGFRVLSMAAGTVQFVGWDNWSGNTVVVSHAGDTWRSVYMHVRNGKSNDCAAAKSKSLANLAVGSTSYTDYKTYLENSGCDQTSPAPGETYWGTNSHTIPVKVGDSVARGQFIAWAGNTGPGGKRGASLSANTHLHMFTTRKDSVDARWYFTDPYGIYAQPECYPSSITGKISGACGRYPRSWKRGRPSYPSGSITFIQTP